MREDLERHVRERRGRNLAELFEFLQIPSVAALPGHRTHLDRAADWLAARLRAAGVRHTYLRETAGAPLVYAEWLGARDRPIVLIHGHYDVLPPGDPDEWESDPFSPEIRGPRIVARGISDSKAPLLAALKAVEALFSVGETLPVNVKFLLDGEQTVGSPHLAGFVKSQAERLDCDVVVSTHGAMWRASQASLTISARGYCGLEVEVATGVRDLNAGLHGGAAGNALQALVQTLASLHDPDGRISVRGFYDGVEPVAAAERARIRTLSPDEETYRRENGLEVLAGEAEFSVLERLWTRPALDIAGVWGGPAAGGGSGVVPSRAGARVGVRLVPGQEPEQVIRSLTWHLERHAPPGAAVRVMPFPGRALPYRVPPHLPALWAASEVIEQVTGQTPVLVGSGDYLPAASLFQEVLGTHTVIFSFANADENAGGPNEFFRLARWDQSILAWIELLHRLAR